MARLQYVREQMAEGEIFVTRKAGRSPSGRSRPSRVSPTPRPTRRSGSVKTGGQQSPSKVRPLPVNEAKPKPPPASDSKK